MRIDDVENVWHGWGFDREFIFDDAGNKYHINDIRSLFYERQLHEQLIGDQFGIRGMKQELENKLKMLNSKIIIQLVNDQNVLEEVQFKI